MKKGLLLFTFASSVFLMIGAAVGARQPEAVSAGDEWTTSENWSCTNGAGGEGREALEAAGDIKLGVFDAYGVQYSKNEKVTLNGLEFTFVYTSKTQEDRAGFYFSQSKSFDFKGIVALCAPTRWPNQTRWAFANNHDIDGAPKTTYLDTSGADDKAGLGGQIGSQIVANFSNDLEDGLHFKFEHVTKAWWKITMTEIRGSYIWGDTGNYVLNEETGLASVTTYVKDSAMDLDENDAAYLNVIGFNHGYCIFSDFTDGTYQEVAEDPAGAEEIAEYKTAVENALTGYPEDFAASMAEAKAAALAAIDEKTYPSEMSKIVDDYKALIKTEYYKYLGYDQEINNCNGANMFGAWGQSHYAKRLNDKGGIIANLANGWGSRAEFIKRYDPLNFEAKVNITDLAVNNAFFLNFSPDSQGYINEPSRYFTVELLRFDAAIQVVVSTPATAGHNVSVEGWAETDINTFTGKSLPIPVDGNISIEFATADGQTTITANGVSGVVNSSLLTNANKSYVQLGTFNGTGNNKVMVEVQDADSKAYAAGLEAKVTAAQAYYNEHKDAIEALVLEEYTDEQYAQYETELSNLLKKAEGIEKYDCDYYGFTEIFNSLVGGRTVYAGQVAAAIAAAKAKVNGYDANLYREAEQAQLATIKQTALAALEPEDASKVPNTLGAVKAIVDAADAAVAQLKTAAQYEAEEELATYKTDEKAKLAASIDFTLYRDEQVSEIQTILRTAYAKIDASADKAAVDAAVNEAKTSIANIKTDAELTAQELVDAKAAAKNELQAYHNNLDKSKYDADGKAALTKALNDGLAAIDAAADKNAVNSALASAKAAIDAVQTATVVPEGNSSNSENNEGENKDSEKKGGCNGSIVATSALLSTLVLAGAGVIIAKRRKEDK